MSTRIDPDAGGAPGTTALAGGHEVPADGTVRVTSTRTAPVRTAPAATTHLPPRPAERPHRKAPLAWLPLAALAALAGLVLLSLLVINAVDDDGPDGAAGDSLGQSSISDGSGVNGQDGGGSGGAAPAPAPAPAGPALKVGDQDLLRIASGGLTGVAGQPVTGTGRVESVVSDEGFWVGTSATDRVFVFLTPEARGTAGESGYQVKAGETVTLEGTTVALSEQPDVAAGVEANEGRGQLEQQAGFVRASRVALAE